MNRRSIPATILCTLAIFTLTPLFLSGQQASACIFSLEMVDYSGDQTEEAHVLSTDLLNDAEPERVFYPEIFLARLEKLETIDCGEDGMPLDKLKIQVGEGTEVTLEWNTSLTEEKDDGYFYTEYVILVDPAHKGTYDYPDGMTVKEIDGSPNDVLVTVSYNSDVSDTLMTKLGSWLSNDGLVMPIMNGTGDVFYNNENLILYTNEPIGAFSSTPEVRYAGTDEIANGITVSYYSYDSDYMDGASVTRKAELTITIDDTAALGHTFDLYYSDEGVEDVRIENVFTIVGEIDTDSGIVRMAGDWKDLACWGDPVDFATGQFHHQDVDFTVVDPDFGAVSLTRSYCSTWEGDVFGDSWELDWRITMGRDTEGGVCFDRGVTRTSFAKVGGVYMSPPGFNGKMAHISGDPDYFSKIEFPDGTVWKFTTNNNTYNHAVLSVVEKPNGRTLEFEYVGGGGDIRISKIKLSNYQAPPEEKQVITFVRNGDRYVDSVTYPSGSGTQQVEYSYVTLSGKKFLWCVSYPGGKYKYYKYMTVGSTVLLEKVSVLTSHCCSSYGSLPASHIWKMRNYYDGYKHIVLQYTYGKNPANGTPITNKTQINYREAGGIAFKCTKIDFRGEKGITTVISLENGKKAGEIIYEGSIRIGFGREVDTSYSYVKADKTEGLNQGELKGIFMPGGNWVRYDYYYKSYDWDPRLRKTLNKISYYKKGASLYTGSPTFSTDIAWTAYPDDGYPIGEPEPRFVKQRSIDPAGDTGVTTYYYDFDEVRDAKDYNGDTVITGATDVQGHLYAIVHPLQDSKRKIEQFVYNNSSGSVRLAEHKVLLGTGVCASGKTLIAKEVYTYYHNTHDVSGEEHFRGRIHTITLHESGGNEVTTYNSYYKSGRPREITYPNGHKATYTYDALGRTTSELHEPVSDTPGDAYRINYYYTDCAKRPGTEEYCRFVQTVLRNGTTETSPIEKMTVVEIDNQGRSIAEWRVINLPGNGYNGITDGGTPSAKTIWTITTDAANPKTMYEYDGSGNLAKITKPEGNYVKNEYDERNLLMKEYFEKENGDPELFAEYYYYRSGYPVSTKYTGNNALYVHAYDEFGRKHCTVSPTLDLDGTGEGDYIIWREWHNNHMGSAFPGQVTTERLLNKTKRPPASSVANKNEERVQLKKYKYYPDNFIKESEEFRNAEQTAGSITLYLGNLNDGNYKPRSEDIDPTGVKYVEIRDGLGRVKESYVDGFKDKNKITYHYASGGRIVVTKELDEDDTYYTRSDYDFRGNLIHFGDFGTTDPTTGTINWATAKSNANYIVTDYEYDAAGSLTLITDPKGVKTRTYYDALGRTIKTSTYTGTGAPTWPSATSAPVATDDFAETILKYDKNFNLIGEQDDKGNWTHYTYNNRDLLTGTYYGATGVPSGGAPSSYVNCELLEYDNNGNVSYVIKADHGVIAAWVIIKNTYDVRNLLISEEVINSHGTYTSCKYLDDAETSYNRTIGRRFKYDALGRVVDAYTDMIINMGSYYYPDWQVKNNVTHIHREYDSLFLLAETQNIDGNFDDDFADDLESKTVSYRNPADSTTPWYDNAGRPLGLVYPSGLAVHYDQSDDSDIVDDLRRVRRVRVKFPEKTTWVNDLATYSYVGALRLKERIYHNSTRLVVGHYSGENYVSGYDAHRRVVEFRNEKTSGTDPDIASFNYGYDKNSNRTAVSKSHTPFSETRHDLYTYDNLNRITDVYCNATGTDPAASGFGFSRRHQFDLDMIGNRVKTIIDPDHADDDGNPYKYVEYGDGTSSGNVNSLNQYPHIETSWVGRAYSYIDYTDYDAGGNMESVSFGPDSLQHCDYDGANKYGFDYLNQMVLGIHNVTLPYDDEDSVKCVGKYYYYDAFGRKLFTAGKHFQDANYSIYYGAWERFVYHNNSIIEVYSWERSFDDEPVYPTELYIYGINVDERIFMGVCEGNIWNFDDDPNLVQNECFCFFFHTNVQGDVVALTLGSDEWQDYYQDYYDEEEHNCPTGMIMERYFYDVYGRPYLDPDIEDSYHYFGVAYQGTCFSASKFESDNSANTTELELVDVVDPANPPPPIIGELLTGDLLIIGAAAGNPHYGEVAELTESGYYSYHVLISGRYYNGDDDVSGNYMRLAGYYLQYQVARRFSRPEPGCNYVKRMTPNRFLFQGREWDADVEAYNFRARWYSPRLGRFLSRDPMGYLDSMNLYSFVNNNPMCYRDPDGEFVICTAIIIFAVCATVAATADVYVQTDGFDFENHQVDWGRTATVGAIGGVAGVAAYATGGLALSMLPGGFGSTILASGMAGTAGGFTSGFLETTLVSGGSVGQGLEMGAYQGAIGGLTGMAGGAFGALTSRFTSSFAGSVLTGTAGGALIGGGAGAGIAALTGGDVLQGAVHGGIFGGIGGGLSGAAMWRANQTALKKTVRNPYGRRGSPSHRARIAEAEARFGGKGWTTRAGGGGDEVKYGNRYPDLVMKKGDKTIAFQIGKATKGGLPIARERAALADLRSKGFFRHVFFLKY